MSDRWLPWAFHFYRWTPFFHTHFREKGDPHGIKRNGKKAALSSGGRLKSDYEIKLKQQEIVQEVGNANMLTKALIDRLINKVYVFPGDRIEIEYATQNFLETKESEKEG